VKINVYKFDLALARECKASASLRKGVSPQTLTV